MKQKFPSVTIAVDKNRCHGIDTLMENDKNLDVVLLDDAFQHRYVKPGINILLVDYHRLIIYDTLLPAGRLREPLQGKDRADIVIVTKCPKDMKPMEYRVITKAMSLYPYQRLYFSTLDYDALKPVFKAGGAGRKMLSELSDFHTLLLTGIGSPQQLEHDLAPLIPHISPLAFPDHHQFCKKDIQLINETFAAMPSPKCIITTEKDVTRLKTVEGLSDEVRKNLYVLPARITFLQDQEEMFNQQIIGYVRKNSRNSILAQGKDEDKSKDSDYSGNRPRTISFRNN
jgi:tetraacyldisaccharide 4'-kinase